MAPQQGQSPKVTWVRSVCVKDPHLIGLGQSVGLCSFCTNESYDVFSLQENAIGDEGASAMAGALKVNTTLIAL